jgi:hypothetical protein
VNKHLFAQVHVSGWPVSQSPSHNIQFPWCIYNLKQLLLVANALPLDYINFNRQLLVELVLFWHSQNGDPENLGKIK